MRLFLSLAAHFKHCDGRLYSMELPYELYASRYLGVFDELMIVARSAPTASPPEGWHEVTGPGLSFTALPDYLGPWQFMKVRAEVKRLVDRAIDACDAHMLRVPCDIGSLAWRALRKKKRPYALEVVADPWLSLSPGSNKSIVRPLARRLARRALRRQCRVADAALYLTNEYLQRQYPPGRRTFTVACSEAYLPSYMYVDQLDIRNRRLDSLPDRLKGRNDPVRLGFIGTLNVLYKAPDIAIQSLALLRKRGLNVRLLMVGGGSLLQSMRDLAAAEGVGDSVEFMGRIPAGQPIADFLDTIDLFLNASRQEGLPRALQEAMARGCPAVGSLAGGIPELLPDEFLVPAGNARALADTVQSALSDTARLKLAAARNLDLARQYADELLGARRHEYYLAFKNMLAARGSTRADRLSLPSLTS